MKDSPVAKYIVPVASKTLDILEAFRSPQEALTLREVIDRTGVAHATAFRILFTLTHRGYLRREGSRYRLAKFARKAKIGYAALSDDVAISVAIQESLRKAAADAAMDLLLLNNQEKPETVIANAHRFVKDRVNVAIVFQNNSEVSPVIADILASADIPAIAIHIPQPRAVYFGPDNYRAGWTAGVALGEHATTAWARRFDLALLLDIPQGGPTLQSRMTGVLGGLEHALGSVPREKVLRVDGGGGRTQSRDLMMSILRERSKARRLLISATSDESALAAVEAVRACGRAETAAIIGHDGSDEALRALRERRSPLLGTVGFLPHQYGPRLIELCTRIMKREAVPPFVYIAHELITRENVRKFTGSVLY